MAEGSQATPTYQVAYWLCFDDLQSRLQSRTLIETAVGCNSPRYLEDYEALGTSPGACHHCHTGRCPVGVATQDPDLGARVDLEAASERVYRFLTAMAMEASLLAKACGKSSVHNLEPEDLRALTLEASAFTGVSLVGADRPFSW